MLVGRNILVSQIHGIGTVARGVMLEILQNLINENPKSNIYYLSCSNSFNVCHVNLEKEPEICFLCKKGIKQGLKLISGNFVHVQINDIINKNDIEKAGFFVANNHVINKELNFEDYPVGEAAVSSYISKSRDRNLVDINKSDIKDLVLSDIALFLGLNRFFEKIKFSEVYNFNGRNSYQKAVMVTARKHGINCFNKEVARPGGYLETFVNVIPHNINAKQKLVEDNWENSDLEELEREEIGSRFFQKKIMGENLNDKAYTRDQVKYKLPPGIDFSKRSFVLFTSSDDEFAAVGEEYDNPFFRDQNEGIEYIVRIFEKHLPNCNLIIRMHPNLKGLNFKYVQDLKKIGEYLDNVFVVHPESPVDSYTLLKKAEKVLVFGSTIGVEANFWGKPVVLLGKAFYYFMDIAYTPKEKNQILDLIENPLVPKNNKDAIKLGFYFLEGGEKAKYYSNNESRKVFFKKRKLYDFSLFTRNRARFIKAAYKIFKTRLFVK